MVLKIIAEFTIDLRLAVSAKEVLHLDRELDGLVDGLGRGVGALVALHSWWNNKIQMLYGVLF